MRYNSDEIIYNLRGITNVPSRSGKFWPPRLEAVPIPYKKYIEAFHLVTESQRQGDSYLVVFSPETFVIIRNGTISSFPMKGTSDASFPGAAEILLQDGKARAEHLAIVDLLRKDLCRVTPPTPLLRGAARERMLEEGLLTEKLLGTEDPGRFSKASLINAMCGIGEHTVKIENIFR